MPTISELLATPIHHPIEALITQVMIKREMETLSNEEVAALLIDHVWSEMTVYDLQSVIVSVAVDRLRD